MTEHRYRVGDRVRFYGAAPTETRNQGLIIRCLPSDTTEYQTGPGPGYVVAWELDGPDRPPHPMPYGEQYLIRTQPFSLTSEQILAEYCVD